MTRPAAQAAGLVEAVRALGGEPLVHPVIEIVPPRDLDLLDAALDGMAAYEWVAFTSANAARALHQRLERRERDEVLPHLVRLAAIGGATASAVSRCFRTPDLVASRPDARTLADEIPVAAGTRVLFPCAEDALPTLPSGLRERGAHVDVIVAYRTVATPEADALAERVLRGEVDAILLASGSAARAVAEAAERARARSVPAGAPRTEGLPPLVCIGRTTAEAVVALGLRPAAVAASQSEEGLMSALRSFLDAEG